MKNSNRPISKSQYLKGRHCLKRIWLYNYHRELMEERSAFHEAILTQGIEVGKLAQSLFPNGILISEDYRNLTEAIEHTKQAIADKALAIFEATFVFENILIRVDILKRNDDGTYDLIEVKSGTSVKKEHLPDCAVQLYVLQGLGFKINRVCIMHLNNKYVRRGVLDISQLFVIAPINEKIENELENVPFYLNKINDVLSQNEEPFWQIGSICKNPYTCEFKNHCWKEVKSNSIYFLTRINDKQIKKFVDDKINLINQISDDYPLTMEAQKIQLYCEKNNCEYIDNKKLNEHLSQLQYPLYFLDFETYGYAIPQYEGTRPYQHLPFQYSLHIKRNAEAELEHYEFLFYKKENPSRALAEHLLQHIGEEGSVVVYYASFEGNRIKEMANEFHDLSFALEALRDRLWDLQIPFAKRWYCHPDLNGSASIKSVLPVLVPNLSYKNLDIQKGDVAQAKYTQLINLQENSSEKEKIITALLAYCCLDTIAMEAILSVLLRLRS